MSRLDKRERVDLVRLRLDGLHDALLDRVMVLPNGTDIQVHFSTGSATILAVDGIEVDSVHLNCQNVSWASVLTAPLRTEERTAFLVSERFTEWSEHLDNDAVDVLSVFVSMPQKPDEAKLVEIEGLTNDRILLSIACGRLSVTQPSLPDRPLLVIT